MIRIMIVEDDLLTRIGIASMLRGEDTKFEIVAEADNGQDALTLAMQLRPDIIITDVEMPLMNGIELIRSAKQKELEAKFVILSAYKDFEYVREGVLLGAEDYLLKLELDKDRLIALLDSISQKFNIKKEAEQSTNAFEQTVRSEHSKARCVYNIVTGHFKSHSIIQKALDACGLQIEEQNLVCILAFKDYSIASLPIDTNTSTQMHKTMLGVLANYGDGYGCIIDTNFFCYIISLRDLKNAPLSNEYLEKLKNDILLYVKNTLSLSLKIIISELSNSFDSISSFFNNQCSFDNGHYFLSNIATKSFYQDYNFAAELSLIDSILQDNNIDDIEKSFDALLVNIKKYKNISTKMLHSVCYILIYFVDRFIKKHLYLDINWSRSAAILDLNKTCKIVQNYVEFINSLKETFISSLKIDKNHNTAILRSKQFIKQNYSRNISLNEVAFSVNLAPAYFSRLFSQVTGTGYINYLTDIRIAKAKELLRSTDMKIHEISIIVGYINTYYFSRVFKKETGLTPNNYRQNM